MNKIAEIPQTAAIRQPRYDALGGGAHDALFAGAGIKLADRVLDVGCGTGATTRIAARLAARGHVVGVDREAPLLRGARISSDAHCSAGVAKIRDSSGSSHACTPASARFLKIGVDASTTPVVASRTSSGNGTGPWDSPSDSLAT